MSLIVITQNIINTILISNIIKTVCSTIKRVINKIGRPQSGSLIC